MNLFKPPWGNLGQKKRRSHLFIFGRKKEKGGCYASLHEPRGKEKKKQGQKKKKRKKQGLFSQVEKGRGGKTFFGEISSKKREGERYIYPT